MVQNKYNISLVEILLQCMSKPDPMLSMLEWMCEQLMETEVSEKLGANKNEQKKKKD